MELEKELEFNKEKEWEYIKKIEESTNLHIKRINERVARMYFTDEEKRKKRRRREGEEKIKKK